MHAYLQDIGSIVKSAAELQLAVWYDIWRAEDKSLFDENYKNVFVWKIDSKNVRNCQEVRCCANSLGLLLKLLQLLLNFKYLVSRKLLINKLCLNQH